MIRLLCVFGLLLVGCVGATPTPPAEPIQLRLATISHLSRLAQNLSQAFSQTYPYVIFELSVMSPHDAMNAVLRREIDVALVAEPVDSHPAELKSAQIGREAVVLAVHPSNPVGALTWDQVRDIFVGQVWDWATVDTRWQSQEILVVSQHEGAGSRLAFENQVMEDLSVTPRAVVATGDEIAGQLIAAEPAAIGYLSAETADDTVKVLSVGGTIPSPSTELRTGHSTVTPGAWPVTRPINLVTHIDANVYVLDFVDFSQSSLRSRPPTTDR